MTFFLSDIYPPLSDLYVLCHGVISRIFENSGRDYLIASRSNDMNIAGVLVHGASNADFVHSYTGF